MATNAGAAPGPPGASVATSRVAAATSRVVAASTTPAVASSSAARASTSAAAVASSSSAAVASSSAAAASSSSSSAAASSSSLVASSLSAASASSASSASQATASTSAGSIVGAASGTAITAKKSLSGGTIGAIVGGVVGGLALVLLIWYLLRLRKERAERVAPPPPREVNYNPATLPRSMESMGNMPNRGNSFSGLLANGRPSSTYPSQSRPQSYYATYPVATPSSFSHDNSPPMPPVMNDSPPFSAQPSGPPTPSAKPSLTPITTTGLHRDDSSSSGEAPIQMHAQPRHKSSVDRLRNAAAGPSRAPSPASVSEFGETTASLRSSSPHPSTHAFPGTNHNPHRPAISSSLSPTPSQSYYPRPYSTHSLASSAWQMQPQGNAPHQRSMQLEMPKLLGARPDSTGDFFWGQARPPTDSFSLGMDGHRRQASRDFMPDGNGNGQHTRYSSMQSMSARTNPDAHEPPPADPRMVLNRV